jgi:hypothetical protein
MVAGRSHRRWYQVSHTTERQFQRGAIRVTYSWFKFDGKPVNYLA